MATFAYNPDYGSPLTQAPATHEAQFADGYSQRSTLGINTIKRRWSLTFTRGKSEIDTIRTFLETRGAVESFDWTPVGYNAGTWICKNWATTEQDSGTVQLSAQFEEVFGE